MKKNILIIASLFLCLQMAAWNSPITIPDVGNARLRIVGQNMENYLTNFEASNSSCSNQSEFDTKTNKMANVFLALNADIVAVCEAERNDEILGYLCTAMNNLSGTNVWTYIQDGNYSYADAGDYQAIKSGYIYRSDKVTPMENSYSPYSSAEYKARMRIQLFIENATNELFTLSINHFKAKSGSDQGESTRLQNVSNLLSALNNITADPDILIMGDLNAYMGEQPIINLQNAGYEEQLTRFDANAYTYVYQGSYGILDHCMANSTMATQITGAYAYNINHEASYSYKYSDHDAVLVGLNLGEQTVIEDTIPTVECPSFSYDFTEGLNDWTVYDVSGTDLTWSSNSSYGAVINAYKKSDNQEHWLISPALNMTGVSSATLTINHAIYYDNGITGDYVTDQTVWVSTDYTDGMAPSTATWTQIPFTQYNKSFTDDSATIPTIGLSGNTHIAFKYLAPLAVDCNYWEIKTASIETECEPIADAIENTEVEAPKARKVIYNGQLYIEFNGMWYDGMGRVISNF